MFGKRKPQPESPILRAATFESNCPTCHKKIRIGELIVKARLSRDDGKAWDQFICEACAKRAENRAQFGF